MGKTVLVVGGYGFMGSHFVRYILSQQGVSSVAVFDNLSYAADRERLKDLAGQFREIIGDIRDLESLRTASRGFDVVVNFAAETHNDNSLTRPADFVSTNINGTFNLLECSRENGFRFHQVSTDEVFGDLPIESMDLFDEDSTIRPSSPYSASKAGADALVLAWHRSFGVPVSLTNAANNFGSGQHPEKLIPRSMSLIEEGRMPELYGSGLNVRDWLYVEDHSSAVWLAVNGPVGERYLVGADQLVSNLDLIRHMNACFGRPPEAIQFVNDRPGHDRKYASNSSKMRSLLGWVPAGPSVFDWLARTIQTRAQS
jgi:dTDP-glucose 4,6-dehydratase